MYHFDTMNLIFIVLITVIYIQNGLNHLIPFVICLFLFYICNFLVVENPFSKELQFIRLFSIVIILTIIYLNSTTLLVLLSNF
jgi:hypothetical protein